MSQTINETVQEVTKAVAEVVKDVKQEVKSISEKEHEHSNKIVELQTNIEKLVQEKAALASGIEKIEKESSVLAAEVKSYKDIAFRLSGSNTSNVSNEEKYKELVETFLPNEEEVKMKSRSKEIKFLEEKKHLLSKDVRTAGYLAFGDSAEQKNIPVSPNNVLRSDVYPKMGILTDTYLWDGSIRQDPLNISVLRQGATVRALNRAEGWRIVRRDTEAKISYRKEAETVEFTTFSLKDENINFVQYAIAFSHTVELLERSSYSFDSLIGDSYNRAYSAFHDEALLDFDDSGSTSMGIRKYLAVEVIDKSGTKQLGLVAAGKFTREDVYRIQTALPSQFRNMGARLMLSKEAIYSLKSEKSLENYQNTAREFPTSAVNIFSGRGGAVIDGLEIVEHPLLDDFSVVNTDWNPKKGNGLIGFLYVPSHLEIGIPLSTYSYYRDFEPQTYKVAHYFRGKLGFKYTHSKTIIPIFNRTTI